MEEEEGETENPIANTDNQVVSREEEGETEILVATTDEQDVSSDIWKRSLSELELEPEPEPEKLGIQEDLIERVMKWLELEIASTSPSSSSSSFLHETEFVTINGNEETCGSSFSGTSSTVMASIDTRYAAPYLGSLWPFAGGEKEVAPTEEEVVGGGEIETEDGLGVDDEWMDFIVAGDIVEISDGDGDGDGRCVGCGVQWQWGMETF